ncbi:PREDICTED: uncharacterized protein LOC104768230 [Camelina sativa]|uniref:Uncharacterized protein LOC104768230 n=1 Tax=Camelina sativa TaxID=90675 RepID=A0ABM0XSN3_CAMSA|nr:PREDICTED: uncharacterized protein LOC104768230 [Camelina sativa]
MSDRTKGRKNCCDLQMIAPLQPKNCCSLSFAGRLQLLKSVISGTINFWISTFMLPKGCIKRIESLCSRFLWSGNIENKKGARVAWSTVCLPKAEGGLGLRSFKEWNKVLCLRFVWLLFSDNGSLWANWHKFHYLRNNTFWTVKEAPTHSWTWNSLLKLRPLAEQFIRAKVGNGQKTSFWFDHWTPLGPLIKLLGSGGPRVLRLAINATVGDACDDQGWTLPAPRSDAALSLHVHLTSIQHPTSSLDQDTYYWAIEGVPNQVYSSSKTWEILRPRQEEKEWSTSVWFKGGIPKHAFNMWLVHLNRLPTRERLVSWGLDIPSDCFSFLRFGDKFSQDWITIIACSALGQSSFLDQITLPQSPVNSQEDSSSSHSLSYLEAKKQCPAQPTVPTRASSF